MARRLLTALTTREQSAIEVTIEITAEEVIRTEKRLEEIRRRQQLEQASRTQRVVGATWENVRIAYRTWSYQIWRKIAQRTFEVQQPVTKHGREFYLKGFESAFLAETLLPEPTWAQLLFRLYTPPRAVQLRLEQLRRHRTREQLIEREFEVVRLEPRFRVILDVAELARLEANLFERYGLLMEEALNDVINMCRLRQTLLTEKPQQKALQKMLMQIYVPYFHARPYTMNLLAIRVTPLTLQYLRNKPATYYIYGVVQYEMLKQKALTKACEKRRQETKLMASSSGCGSTRPIKFSQGYTDALTGEEKVGVPKDHTGKELLWMALRYAYSMPYWLRRFIAVHTGMPENHKYARYFGIGCIPSRRKTWRKYERHFPEAQYLYYSVDKQVMNAIKRYRKRYRETYPERGKRRYRRRI